MLSGAHRPQLGVQTSVSRASARLESRWSRRFGERGVGVVARARPVTTGRPVSGRVPVCGAGRSGRAREYRVCSPTRVARSEESAMLIEQCARSRSRGRSRSIVSAERGGEVVVVGGPLATGVACRASRSGVRRARPGVTERAAASGWAGPTRSWCGSSITRARLDPLGQRAAGRSHGAEGRVDRPGFDGGDGRRRRCRRGSRHRVRSRDARAWKSSQQARRRDPPG